MERRERSAAEVFLLLIAMVGTVAWECFRAGILGSLDYGPDAYSYIDGATLIQKWAYAGPYAHQHFLGFSFAIAGVSSALRVSPASAFFLVSAASSMGACCIIYKLWGAAHNCPFFMSSSPLARSSCR